MIQIADLRIEKAKTGAVYVVEGPYEWGYGRQFLGRVTKVGRGFTVVAPDNRCENGERYLGTKSSRSDAIQHPVEWANANLTSEALQAEFEDKTAGGHPLQLSRRTSYGVTANVLIGPMKWVAMTWKADGFADFYSDDPDKAEAFRLVSKAPALELEGDAAPGIRR